MRRGVFVFFLFLLTACTTPFAPTPPYAQERSNEVVLFSMSLLETGYVFGGKNPEAGLDCSGMVSYIYRTAAQFNLTGSAYDMAHKGQAIRKEDLRPGDLVFFNTLQRPFSHVAIYIGDQRFIHAPSSKGRVRIDKLTQTYWATRFEVARRYLK
jgi:cell wall-associated NlpC family hydrolase